VSSIASVIWHANHIFLVPHYFMWPVWLYYIFLHSLFCSIFVCSLS